MLPVEWTSKIVVRKKIEKLNNEIVNISNMNSFIEAQLSSNNKEIDFKGIHNVVDLNTLAVINDKRFDKNSLDVFLTEANTYMNKIFAHNQVD